MFTKLKNPTVSYISRIAALPLLLIVVASFALKAKPLISGTADVLSKTITVVIDAGHGGNESGASLDNLFEKDLALSISKKIKEQNTNTRLRIVLTRDGDNDISIKDRVQTASDNKADLFLSIHINAAEPEKGTQLHESSYSGMQVVVPTKNPPYQQQSEVLGSVLVQQLGSVYETQTNLIRNKTGVWVIDHNVCPSVLIECGYITNQKDRDYITKNENQTLIAAKILDAIEQYGVLKNNGKNSITTDTVPLRMFNNKVVSNVEHIKGAKQEVTVYFKDGTKQKLSVAEANKANLLDTMNITLTEFTPPVIVKDTIPKKIYKNKAVADVQYFEWPKKEVHLFYADGTKENISVKEAFKAGLFDSSAQLQIEKRPWANEKLVDPLVVGKESVTIRILSAKDAANWKGMIVLNDKVFNGEWQQLSADKDKIELIATSKGNEVENKYGLKTGDSLLSVYTKSYIEKNRRTDNEPLFTQPEVEPKFPDTNGGWQTFLQKNLDADVPVMKGAPAGTYKVTVGFIVDKDGKIYDIKPATNLGFGMEEEVVRLMKNSPDWIPAKQNGHVVTAYKKQTITFIISEG